MTRLLPYLTPILLAVLLPACRPDPPAARPNILIAISDDQSWPHAGAYGARFVTTPHFDRVAREGILFTGAFAPSPGCAPSRSALVTGRYPWQNAHAGNHASLWPQAYQTFPDWLTAAGYHVGFTGKGVAPFQWAMGGRETNPAGPEYNLHKLEPPFDHISRIDYAANFRDFLAQRSPGQPFCFWYGATEPHRAYDARAGAQAGKDPAGVTIPPFLPDLDTVREDLLRYATEIEWFDRHLGDMLAALEAAGELDNTLIIVTSDNGMPFPAAKANGYEYGIHVPLAIRWGAEIAPQRQVDDLVSFVDIAPTLLELAGIAPAKTGGLPITGRSLTDLFYSQENGWLRAGPQAVYASRERHSSSRWANLGYPQRMLRTPRWLYIRNYHPERWPAGAPLQLLDDGQPGHGFTDVDWGGTDSYFIYHQADSAMAPYIAQAFGKRPAEQLFDVRADPGCRQNRSGDPALADTLATLRQQMTTFLQETEDPREVGPDPDLFETFPRYSPIRRFPEPDWVDGVDSAWLAQLLPRIGQDERPLQQPQAAGPDFLRTSRWLVQRQGQQWVLFDLQTDPERKTDVSDRYPHTRSQLLRWHDRLH
ncbi:MAG: hypothetical protein D6722_21950 [Bacteroidetes bacterium]|nr:MAG: hypothetical protein D6722_21950 [Bacteroidota bacterium]